MSDKHDISIDDNDQPNAATGSGAGGPGAQTGGTGGEENDVASGGTTEHADDEGLGQHSSASQ